MTFAGAAVGVISKFGFCYAGVAAGGVKILLSSRFLNSLFVQVQRFKGMSVKRVGLRY
ncbi:hypothetical protein [Shewanella gaetbuli]|uniref:Uncharacterized protein n=1 Tax=Shewanella gaetbuli TaxID=220752 RepID=A0A9X2CL51_9GAMM|nr:hypothetical protein [Shewanella gaetbuli]MCL1143791.1 hypothetical protein [Shewanella gaetbuli]